MSIVALLYLILTPLIKQRYSEKGCYYGWLIILIGLIIPFRPQWENVIFNVNIPTYVETTMQTSNETLSNKLDIS